jgi:hypothetical protein
MNEYIHCIYFTLFRDYEKLRKVQFKNRENVLLSFRIKRQYALNLIPWRMQRFFIQYIWIFSTQPSTVLAVNVPIQMAPCLALKNKFSNV